MNSRRHSMLCLMAGAASLAGPLRALAARPRALSDPLRLGVDDALVDSGPAPALVRGYGRDTGLPVLLLHGPASAMLGAAERGENDLALTNTPEAEAALVAHG